MMSSSVPFRLAAVSVLVMGACRDNGLTAFNAEPKAEITSHSDGQEVDEGVPILLQARVSDPDDELGTLDVTWKVAGAEVCSGAPESDGLSSCELTLEPGEMDVLVEVVDPDGNVAPTTPGTPREVPTAPPQSPRRPNRAPSDPPPPTPTFTDAFMPAIVASGEAAR